MGMFTYVLTESSKYIRNCRNCLLKANSLLFINITDHKNKKIIGDDVIFNHEDISELAEYLPYHDDVYTECRLAKSRMLMAAM